MVKLYNPESTLADKSERNVTARPAQGTPIQTPRPASAPATAPTSPAQDDAFKPRAGVDYTKTPLFPNMAALDAAVAEARTKPGAGSVLFQWFKATGAKEVKDVIEAQRRLLSQSRP